MRRIRSSAAETACLYGAVILALMTLLSRIGNGGDAELRARRERVLRPCDELYVVREGETLHTISEKCGDPYIVEENPHIHDPDDVIPGLVIKITPLK
uniref:LysM domain-containing protein n=1 Tax=Kalanchoe fedtschenkoi TaxID=63787 RepID=A0A7N0SWY6_KALFE